MNRKKYTPLAALAGLALAAGSAHGALLVYEGFNYTDVGDDLIGKGGTSEIGLTGTWADEDSGADNMFLKSGSLSFNNLATSGNHIGYNSNAQSDRYNRELTATATTEIGTIGSSNGSLYFSFLFEKLQNNFGADHEGLALMNGILPQARWDSGNAGAVGRHGFAVAAVDGQNLQAVAYNGTTGARVVSTEAITIALSTVYMIAGEISFNTGTGGADVFNLYSVANDGTLDRTLIGMIEADVDESLLNTLNLTRQVNVNYDEVRFGTSFDDVIAVIPEPTTALLGGLGFLALLRRRR